MKKYLAIMIIIVALFSFSACTESPEPDSDFSISNIKQKVKGWKIYTNPAYRYELRYPTSWEYKDSGEDGKMVGFYPGKIRNSIMQVQQAYPGVLRILCYSNWQENYSLEEFYQNRYKSPFADGYEQVAVEFDGKSGIWFKSVKDRVPGHPDSTVDLIVFDLQDRIIEFEIQADFETSQIVLNSINFYPARGLSDL